MGLIKAVFNAVGGNLADQWLEVNKFGHVGIGEGEALDVLHIGIEQ